MSIDYIDYEIQELNRKYFMESPADASVQHWSGCNYYVNQGENEVEPLGTASSMHDCGGCRHIQTCLLKKQTPIWRWNEDIESQSDTIAKAMKLR